MINMEKIDELSKIEGENLITIYLNVNKKNISPLVLKTKVKDLFKETDFSEAKKKNIEDKILNYLSGINPNTKSVGIFASENYWLTCGLHGEIGDYLSVDYVFNLKPLTMFLSEGKNIGILLLDNKSARFFSLYQWELEGYKHFEDKILPRQENGGWSQERFEHRREEYVKSHLKRSADFLVKAYNFYKFEHLFLRKDPEITNQFINILPKEIKNKIRGEIAIDMDTPAQGIISKVMELDKSEVKKEETGLIEQLENALKDRIRHRAISGMDNVFSKFYDNKVDSLLINEDFSERGFYCQFCGYLSVENQFCPYCQSVAVRVKDIISVLIKKAIERNITVNIFKDDPALKRLGNIAAFIKEY